MSIQTRCPNCDASYNLAEAQRGKKVRCRKCSETFVVGERTKRRAGGLRREERQDPPGRLAGFARAPAAGHRRKRDRPRPAATGDEDREDDEEEEEDSRDRRGRREKSRSAAPLILLLCGGVLLLLLMGGGVLVFAVRRHESLVQSGRGQPVRNPAPDGRPRPTDVDDALLWIRTAQTADKQNKAAEWLARATVIDAKRKDVAAVLEKLVSNANTHDSAVKALAQWAGPEDVPTLLTAVEIDNGLWAGDRAGGEAADALVRLQADGVAGAFAHRLHGFGHENAKKRLAANWAPRRKRKSSNHGQP